MFKSYARKGKLPKKNSEKKFRTKKTCKKKSSEKKSPEKKVQKTKNHPKKSSEKIQKFNPLKVQKFLNFASRLRKEAPFCSEMEFRNVKVLGGVV